MLLDGAFRGCLGRAVWGVVLLPNRTPAGHPIPRSFFRIGPPGSHYRGDLEGRPRQARGAQADVGRATLEDSSKVSSAGQGGRQELPPRSPLVGAPSNPRPAVPATPKNNEEEQEEAPPQGWAHTVDLGMEGYVSQQTEFPHMNQSDPPQAFVVGPRCLLNG